MNNVIKSNKEFDYAFTPKDVIKNFKKNKISLPMGMENGSPIGKDINRINSPLVIPKDAYIIKNDLSFSKTVKEINKLIVKL